MDFKILNPPPTTIWRDPRHKPATGWRRYAVGTFSLLTLVLGLLPPSGGYAEPISFQLARGEVVAWLLFTVMGLALSYVAFHSFRQGQGFSGLFCSLAVIGLVAIALTNPRSSLHLGIFSGVVLALLLWLWGIRAEFQDFKFDISFYAALIGTLLCLFRLGLGERTIILSSLFALNVLFYGYVLY